MTTPTHPLPTPPDPDDDPTLPCGRHLSDAWTAWEDGYTDDHPSTCPHCAAAVEELRQLSAAVHRMGQAQEQDPAEYDTTSLTDRVMNIVRAELRPGRPLPLGEPDEAIWINESTAARVLRAAAERVPGVRAGSCRITPDPASRTLSVSLHIVAPADAPNLLALADDVRRAAQEAADARLGLNVTGIDVRITGLTDPHDATKGAGR
ncbi:Asp23/Gls24 family envelope stress response protein [Streptomyces sp. NPDC048507]|uniref:Asp23/Gls24 family envelope stress response protein n=1 Tax=Streptomyces sp. NPDC048507 TaxID=3365560 RepID=UPI0037117361